MGRVGEQGQTTKTVSRFCYRPPWHLTTVLTAGDRLMKMIESIEVLDREMYSEAEAEGVPSSVELRWRPVVDQAALASSS